MKGMIRGKFFVIIASAVIVIVSFEFSLLAEFVFLKDGSIIEGTITKDAQAHITIRTNDKKIQQVPRNQILRILYTKLKMGKVYIQKRDGKGLIAYIVDEDQDSYTFRKDLYKPEEFSLKRSEVLFISEKNPSGLQVDGEVSTDRVSLFWHPPYDEVKKYNIYIKKSEKDKYELRDGTKNKSITLKNLISNTTYYIIVTSTDTENYESPPSNELKITTKNIPPTKPVMISADKYVATGELKMAWEASTDPDGKVVKYRIYGTRDKKRAQVAEVKATAYVFKNALGYEKVELAAVDDRGDESPSALAVSDIGFNTRVKIGVLYPFGALGDILKLGYGGSAGIFFTGYLFKKSAFGLDAGYYHWTGKDANYEYMHMMPVTLWAGYRLNVSDRLRVMPEFHLGAAYMISEYGVEGLNSSGRIEISKRKRNGADPVAGASISFSYALSASISLSGHAEYRVLIEKKELWHSAGLSLGAVYYLR